MAAILDFFQQHDDGHFGCGGGLQPEEETSAGDVGDKDRADDGGGDDICNVGGGGSAGGDLVVEAAVAERMMAGPEEEPIQCALPVPGLLDLGALLKIEVSVVKYIKKDVRIPPFSIERFHILN